MYTNVSAARIFISINRKTITNTQILKNKCLVMITISWKFLFSMKSTLWSVLLRLSEELLRFGSFLFIHLLIYIYNLFVIDTVQVFLPKCPLTTVRSRFSADELQIIWSEGCIRSITTLKRQRRLHRKVLLQRWEHTLILKRMEQKYKLRCILINLLSWNHLKLKLLLYVPKCYYGVTPPTYILY